eukprot:contig_4224_g923
MSGAELNEGGGALVYFKGLILGVHANPPALAVALRALRRRALIGEFVSVWLNPPHRAIYAACDGGRVCRPLIMFSGAGELLVTDEHMTGIARGTLAWWDLMHNDLIEYLDVKEENNTLIATPEPEIMRPMVQTRTLDLFGFNRLPGGQNASLCVMSYSGYDIKDAVVLNRASVERRFGRCIVLRKHASAMRRYPNNTTDRIMPPPVEPP